MSFGALHDIFIVFNLHLLNNRITWEKQCTELLHQKLSVSVYLLPQIHVCLYLQCLHVFRLTFGIRTLLLCASIHVEKNQFVVELCEDRQRRSYRHGVIAEDVIARSECYSPVLVAHHKQLFSIEVYMEAHGVWEVVAFDDSVEPRKNKMALAVIYWGII